MPLRKSPTRTPAFLAANRANAKKSTGPRTALGKARAALNALKHGRYAVDLQGKLLRAGYHDGAALHRWFRSEIVRAFARPRPDGRATGDSERPAGPQAVSGRGGLTGDGALAEERQAEEFAAQAWCVARRSARQLDRLVAPGTKPGCGPLSAAKAPQPCVLLRIRIDDRRRRIGLVFWRQPHKYWTFERRVGALRALLDGGPRQAVPLDRQLLPVSDRESVRRLERRWRRQRFRLRRPSLWEQIELEKQVVSRAGSGTGHHYPTPR